MPSAATLEVLAMTDGSENPPRNTLSAVKADLTAVSWQERVQTMLMTLGILAFGFMLGVHWFAGNTFGLLPPQSMFGTDYGVLQTVYNRAMIAGVTAAVVGLAGSFLLEFAGRDVNE